MPMGASPLRRANLVVTIVGGPFALQVLSPVLQRCDVLRKACVRSFTLGFKIVRLQFRVDPDFLRPIKRLDEEDGRCRVSFYRLYFRDREGHVSGVREIEAHDDAQAIGRADRMCRDDRRELWRENSLLRRWEVGSG